MTDNTQFFLNEMKIKKSLANIKFSLSGPVCIPDFTDNFYEKKASKYGEGLFSLIYIPKGTLLFIRNEFDYSKNEISFFINDLAYKNDIDEYYDNLDDNINIGYVNYTELTEGRYIGKRLYLIAIKDIEIGEEFSRSYGFEYWKEYEFKQNYKNELKIFEENYNRDDYSFLFEKYIFISELRIQCNTNYCMYLFGKKVNDKYYYLCGGGNKCAFYDKNFETKNRLKDISKNDNSAYNFNDEIIVNEKIHYFTNFLSNPEERNDLSKISFFSSFLN